MTNICHVGFFLCGLYCHLRCVSGRTGCIVNYFVLAEYLKYVVFRVIFSSTQCKRRKGFSCSLLPEGVFLQTVYQILNVFSSWVLKCLETCLWCTFYHISSLLQAPKDGIKSSNHPSQECLRRKKRIIIMFTIAFLFFSWSQLVKSRLTTTLPMTDQNSSVQTQ